MSMWELCIQLRPGPVSESSGGLVGTHQGPSSAWQSTAARFALPLAPRSRAVLFPRARAGRVLVRAPWPGELWGVEAGRLPLALPQAAAEVLHHRVLAVRLARQGPYCAGCAGVGGVLRRGRRHSTTTARRRPSTDDQHGMTAAHSRLREGGGASRARVRGRQSALGARWAGELLDEEILPLRGLGRPRHSLVAGLYEPESFRLRLQAGLGGPRQHSLRSGRPLRATQTSSSPKPELEAQGLVWIRAWSARFQAKFRTMPAGPSKVRCAGGIDVARCASRGRFLAGRYCARGRQTRALRVVGLAAGPSVCLSVFTMCGHRVMNVRGPIGSSNCAFDGLSRPGRDSTSRGLPMLLGGSELGGVSNGGAAAVRGSDVVEHWLEAPI